MPAAFRRQTRKLRTNVLRPVQREPRLEGSQRHRRHDCVRHEIAQIPRDKVTDVLRAAGAKSGEILERLFAIPVEVPRQETCRQVHGKFEEIVARLPRHRANTFSIRRVRTVSTDSPKDQAKHCRSIELDKKKKKKTHEPSREFSR